MTVTVKNVATRREMEDFVQLPPGCLPYFNYNQYVYRQASDVWNQRGVMVSCRVPEDGSQWATQVDILSPMQWSNCRTWADTRVDCRGAAYEALKRRMADYSLGLAEEIFPGLRQMAVRSYSSTPLTWRDYTLTPCGSAYGARKDCRNPLLTMLSPRTPIPNLLLTGQNLMLHGVYGVTMTALYTCAELLGKKFVIDLLDNEKDTTRHLHSAGAL